VIAVHAPEVPAVAHTVLPARQSKQLEAQVAPAKYQLQSSPVPATPSAPFVQAVGWQASAVAFQPQPAPSAVQAPEVVAVPQSKRLVANSAPHVLCVPVQVQP